MAAQSGSLRIITTSPGAELTSQGVYPSKYYYDLPWERVADMYGGVERNYLPGTNENASTFLLITKIIGRLTPW